MRRRPLLLLVPGVESVSDQRNFCSGILYPLWNIVGLSAVEKSSSISRSRLKKRVDDNASKMEFCCDWTIRWLPSCEIEIFMPRPVS